MYGGIPETQEPATETAADMLKSGIDQYDQETGHLHMVFNKLFGKKLPTRNCNDEEDRKQSAFDIQALMNTSGYEVAKMCEASTRQSQQQHEGEQ